MPEEKLVGVHKNRDGEIINFHTSTGRIISYRKAVLEIEAGILSGFELADDGIPQGTSVFDELPELF
ncbi:hypothetical protein CVD25_06610 [Bacillus canaveralius]|uniref:DUF3892 domain-containing protein n=1 Tax=Bacillus canaveralius TaxID=1403243 RepID=A0A2N5GJ95_9BACI|nr:DUF3892 domain-containing protein [Bacillus canaveralius]PLR81079.1 hypothetical protein CU635_16345 [Bacillus canaveralius]PLR98947.1 hypothetical protein CVD25_06610 [Bacillus canaveralius]